MEYMENNPQNMENEAPFRTEEQDEKKSVLVIGEKGFSIILFLVGLVALYLAFQLWAKVDAPKISSAAGVPVIVTGTWWKFKAQKSVAWDT